ncbi:MAG: hypothetical protein RIG77_26735 [Cyclobacteriaceae bacterium]
MKNLSLKLEDNIFSETEEIIGHLNKKRNKYINEAVSYYNRLYKRKLMKDQLLEESRAVYTNSLDTLAEFDDIDDDEFLLD